MGVLEISQSKLLYREQVSERASYLPEITQLAVATLHWGIPGDIEASLGRQGFTLPFLHIMTQVSRQSIPMVE